VLVNEWRGSYASSSAVIARALGRSVSWPGVVEQHHRDARGARKNGATDQSRTDDLRFTKPKVHSMLSRA